ncbi:MAG: protein kinase, partial [Acidimicrobiia bacterium]|nr:protein kinase [Acidimicrobiia bacterium]
MAFDDDGTRPSPTPTTPSSFRPTLVGIVVANRYRIERVATSGSSTVMVDATDIQLERPVTLKLVRPEISELPEFQRRFDQVMRSMTTLSHMNIAAVHDWGEDRIGGRVTMFAAVEYLGGGSLRDLLDRGRLLDASQALVVGLDACRALDYAHRRNLVHGELTPAKLVFGDDRRLRVVDFGLARLLGASAWREPATVGSHVARYASPEQALGQPIDAKTDVYALALSMIESVTGSVPFSADSTVATLSARIGKLTPVSADLGALASVLERAGRPDRNDRWTAAEFGRALIRAAERLPRPTPLPLVTAPAMRPEPTRRPTDPTGGVDRPGTARAGRPPGGPPAVVAPTPAADPDPEPEPAVVAEPETAEPETADTQPVTGDIPLEPVHVAPLQLESDRPAAPAAPVAPDVASEPEPDHLPVSPPPAA